MADLQNLQDYVADALEVVEFKLIRFRDDVEDESIKFHPTMAHQIFGENESIFGYKNLKVNIWYTAGCLQIYIGVRYSNRVDDDYSYDLKSDDIIGILTSKLPDGCYFTSIDEFVATLEKGKIFKPFGEKLTEHIVENSVSNGDDNNAGKERHFEIYQCDFNTSKFPTYFSRLQTFILWFVDAACYIDIDDPQWLYFICYEKYKDKDGNYQYATVGYTTVYKYYAYPEHIRPRISQMLILPPFQRLGIGTKFIETIYQYFSRNPSVVDITVEDSSDDFSRIRNFVDCKLCKNLSSFNPTIIKNGFTKDMIKEAKEKYKINEKQCRKIYEILRLYYTNLNNPDEIKEYRLYIKKRLNLTYERNLKAIEKFEKRGVNMQSVLMTLPSPKERLEKLENEYNEIKNEYMKVVKKLKEID